MTVPEETLTTLSNLSVFLFVFSSMLAIGMRLTVDRLAAYAEELVNRLLSGGCKCEPPPKEVLESVLGNDQSTQEAIEAQRAREAARKARDLARRKSTLASGNLPKKLADCMWTEKKGVRAPMVAHTLNPVPLIIKDFDGSNDFRMTEISEPGLANIAATLCVLLGLQPPADYEPALVAPVHGTASTYP